MEPRFERGTTDTKGKHVNHQTRLTGSSDGTTTEQIDNKRARRLKRSSRVVLRDGLKERSDRFIVKRVQNCTRTEN